LLLELLPREKMEGQRAKERPRPASASRGLGMGYRLRRSSRGRISSSTFRAASR
jgi:hypothetical protein